MKDIDSGVFDLPPDGLYEKCAWLPLDTTIRLDGIRRELCLHNGSQFVWVEGTDLCLPYLIAPVDDLNQDALYGYAKQKIFDDILDYLSLLSVRFGQPVDLHLSYFKNYYGLMSRVLEYHEPWIPRTPRYHSLQIASLPRFDDNLTNPERVIVGLFKALLRSNDIFYSTLTGFKIYEHYFPDYVARNSYIESNWSAARSMALQLNMVRGLGDPDKFLAFVSYYQMNIGEYLYKKCRQAIAHAKVGEYFAQANRYSDYYEMYYASEAVKILSLYLILDKLGERLCPAVV